MLRSWRGAGIVPLVIATLFCVAARPDIVRADEHVIAITDAGLVPAELTVFVGEPVTWTNQTTQARSIVVPSLQLDSGPIGPGESYGHVFEQPGGWPYVVPGDPDLQGTVRALDAPETASAGSPEITPPPGTLPPDFSPVAPSAVPSVALPASAVVATPSSSAVTSTPSGGGGNGAALFLAVAIVGAIAVIAAIAGLIGASRRPGR